MSLEGNNVPIRQQQQQNQDGTNAENQNHDLTSTTSRNNNSSATRTPSESMRQSLTWALVNSSGTIPPARSGAASVVVGNKLYMFGGYGGGTGRLDDFYSFSFETNVWEEVEVLSIAKPGCRENNGVVIGDNSSRVYLFGGYNGDTWLNDLWTFDIETQCWTCVQESSDTDTSAHSSRSIANNLNGSDTVVPSRRFGYVSVVHDNKFILWGGFDGSKWLNDMYEFDFETMNWREIHAFGQLPSVRSCPAWSKDDTRVYIQGGYDGVERKSDFYSCDLSTYTWVEMPSTGTPPSPRYFHSCCLFDNKMYAYGGYSGSQRLSDMYCYDFITEFWSQVDCNHGYCPSGRSSLVAQVHGNNMYVFGGYDGQTVLNDFYKFRLKAISIPSSQYLDHMLGLVNNRDLSDVTFLVEDKEVFANRAILASRSEYFHAMFYSGGMRESIQTCEEARNGIPACDRKPIEIKNVSYLAFVKMLEFIYTDSVKNMNLEIGIPLLVTSERFMLDRLKAICEDVIRQHVTINNVTGILLTSSRHNANGLKEIALEFVLSHLNVPAIIKSLTDLKTEPDLLIEIIRRTSLLKQSKQKSIPPHTPSSGPFDQASGMWNGSRR